MSQSTKVLVFSPLIPGNRFETEVSTLEWVDAKQEIQSALTEKYPENDRVHDLMDKHDANLAGQNLKLTDASLLPSTGSTRLLMTSRKNIDSGADYSQSNYNVLRRDAKSRGITGLGSNPTKEELIVALQENDAVRLADDEPEVTTESEITPVAPNQVISQSIQSIMNACTIISDAVAQLSEITLSDEDREAIASVRRENEEMLNSIAEIEAVTLG